jgi:myo-inositol-1(or 4)-monophosphatase
LKPAPSDTSEEHRVTHDFGDYGTFLAVAERAALAAGEVLQDWSGRFSVTEKARADLVTEADVASQKVVYDLIHSAFPDHGFVGEEGLRENTEAARRWFIDPLDGTSNYVHSFPYYCVSIALEIDRQLAVGVIFDPTRHELFTAVKGGGAFLNGRKLAPKPPKPLSESMLIASFPPGVTAESPHIRRFLTALPVAQTIHRSGSAALNLAYIATGRLDGYWSAILKPWDCAAGVLMVRETGGVVTRLDGGPYEVTQPNLLAAQSTGLQQELSDLFTAHQLT